jgi:hypothetical protein
MVAGGSTGRKGERETEVEQGGREKGRWRVDGSEETEEGRRKLNGQHQSNGEGALMVKNKA